MKICIFCGANSSLDSDVEVMAKKVNLAEIQTLQRNFQKILYNIAELAPEIGLYVILSEDDSHWYVLFKVV